MIVTILVKIRQDVLKSISSFPGVDQHIRVAYCIIRAIGLIIPYRVAFLEPMPALKKTGQRGLNLSDEIMYLLVDYCMFLY